MTPDVERRLFVFVLSTYSKNLLATSLAVIWTFAATSDAAVSVIIQPGYDESSVVWTISWDSLEGNTAFETSDLGFLDPETGLPESGILIRYRQVGWQGVGDPFKSIYSQGDDYAWVDGYYGISSSPEGWGLCPDNDEGLTADDFYMFNRNLGLNDPFPTSGSFFLTVPGSDIANYNLGNYNVNPNISIVVKSEPIPEVHTSALMSAGLFAGLLVRRRKP